MVRKHFLLVQFLTGVILITIVDAPWKQSTQAQSRDPNDYASSRDWSTTWNNATCDANLSCTSCILNSNKHTDGKVWCWATQCTGGGTTFKSCKSGSDYCYETKKITIMDPDCTGCVGWNCGEQLNLEYCNPCGCNGTHHWGVANWSWWWLCF